MAVICPTCGTASRDAEFCDRCNADLVPAPVTLPPSACPLPEFGPISLLPEQLGKLSRPEASVTVKAGGRFHRLHWVAEEHGPLWQPRWEQRLACRAPCLPPCRLVPDRGGFWVVAGTSGDRARPWAEAARLETADNLRRLATFLDRFGNSLETLHHAGLVWLTFDPNELEWSGDTLRFTNLDLAVYPAGHSPDRLTVVPAFAAPEVCRFHDADLGPATDVFHLAVFAFYWLARLLPGGYRGPGLEELEFLLPPLRVYAPALPPGIARVLAGGHAADPGRRYPTVGDLVSAFRQALDRAERRLAATAPVRWEIGWHTRTGLAKTALGRPNEDHGQVRTFSSPERALVVVADGISCCDVGNGAIASRKACDVVEAAVGPDTRANTFAPRMTSACLQAARGLLQWALDHGARPRLLAGEHLMGTTLTAAWVEGNTLTLANLGDSRAYLVDEATVEQLTVDGDLGCTLLAAGARPEEVAGLGGVARALHDCVGGCYRTPGGQLAVDEDRCRPAISRWQLLPGDVVVVCTDGLVDEGQVLGPEELADLVRRHQGLPAPALAEKLAEEADARQRPPSESEPEGFGDNITCAVIKLH
jgi:protein phosphatase